MGRHLIYLLGNVRLRSLTCTVLQTGSAITAPKKVLASYDPRRVRQPLEYAALGPTDRRVLMRLCLRVGMHGTLARLEGEDGAETIEALIRTGRCFWDSPRGQPLRWGAKRPGELDWQVVDVGRLRALVRTEPVSAVLLPVCPLIYVDVQARTAGRVSTGCPSELVLGWLTASEELNAAETEALHNRLSARFPGWALPSPPDMTVEDVWGERPVPILDLTLPRYRTAEGMRATVRFEYRGRSIHASSEPGPIQLLEADRVRRIHRNQVEEGKALRLLESVGFAPLRSEAGIESGDPPVVWVYRPAGAEETNEGRSSEESEADPGNEVSLAGGLRVLEGGGWRLTWDRSQAVEPIDGEAWYTSLTAGDWNWFEFEAGIEVNGKRINLLPVLHKLLQQSHGWSLHRIRRRLLAEPVCVPIADGRVGVLSGKRLWRVVEQLFELFDDAPLGSNQRLALDGLRAAEIIEFEEFAAEPWEATHRVRRLVELLRRGLELRPHPAPAGLRTELRSYQQQGLAWLQLLREYEMDGILADDMGLGKTVQALAHLLVEKEAGRLERPCLIVSPTSVLSNWAGELERHAPGLSWMILHGKERNERFERLATVDVALTTYPLLYRDVDRYRDRPFSYVILDEAQFIKNARSQVAQVVSRLVATRRLCLTGTPLENHLGELWALFQFLMPGFLGDSRAFKTRFRDPIEKEGLADRQTVLARRVAPFLLRRTKGEVERELPPKTEIIQRIPLTARQQELYESVRAAMDSRIREEISAKGLRRSHIIILDALLKLRQICCDPRLLLKGRSRCGRTDSGKLRALLELLPELIEDQRRVLLFSQFTSMLALIEIELRRLKIPYRLLTGSTLDRAEPIRQFQEGKVPLFLISLKAGGTGLNLTAADTVIHYDPWWNPAVENQATDRAHRIGQNKPVFVYKLLTEGTVEAKIQQLQEKKRRLVEGILAGSLKGKLTFTEQDLVTLFEPVCAVADE